MNVEEWAEVFAILKTGAVLVVFPFGVAVGYAWRAHISHVRRVRYLTARAREQRWAKPDGADAAQVQAGSTMKNPAAPSN
jgi:hypothetical protein